MLEKTLYLYRSTCDAITKVRQPLMDIQGQSVSDILF